MEVNLLSYTPEPLNVLFIAAKQCKLEYPIITANNTDDLSKKALINLCIRSHHYSILEHVSFTFQISGISRACSHQLVRHRLASYSQLSQRYYGMTDTIQPKTITDNPEANKTYNMTLDTIAATYNTLISLGIPEEDARYILPNAATTSLVVTMNARELYCTFFPLRCCTKAQWEIRALANKMLDICKKELPVVFINSGPNCITYGNCYESKPCKEKFKINH